MIMNNRAKGIAAILCGFWAIAVLFFVYQLSLNGRYQAWGNGGVIIDTRTGALYTPNAGAAPILAGLPIGAMKSK